MAKGLYIEVKGFKEAQKQLGNKVQAVIDVTDFHMGKAAKQYENLAAQSAFDVAFDEGRLAGAISSNKKAVMNHEVVSPADYSAYVEFGTKTKVDVPADLADYAAQFKGKGKGSGKGLFEKIYEWVKRKGIAATKTKSGRRSTAKAAQQAEYAAARAIYYHILKYGTKAQPFFFKHRKTVYAQLQKELGPAIKKALGK